MRVSLSIFNHTDRAAGLHLLFFSQGAMDWLLCASSLTGWLWPIVRIRHLRWKNPYNRKLVLTRTIVFRRMRENRRLSWR